MVVSPSARPTWIAAAPTPPAAPCTSSTSPGCACPRRTSAKKPQCLIRRKAAVVVIGWVGGRTEAVGALLLAAHDQAGSTGVCPLG